VTARISIGWSPLPWNKRTESEIDLVKAKEVLDNDHYDLEKIKERILDTWPLRKNKPDIKGPISASPGLRRGQDQPGQRSPPPWDEFHRISLGACRDEAEIRGARRTYIGALPGQIIRGCRRTESRNPVFMLDEIDKIGATSGVIRRRRCSKSWTPSRTTRSRTTT